MRRGRLRLAALGRSPHYAIYPRDPLPRQADLQLIANCNIQALPAGHRPYAHALNLLIVQLLRFEPCHHGNFPATPDVKAKVAHLHDADGRGYFHAAAQSPSPGDQKRPAGALPRRTTTPSVAKGSADFNQRSRQRATCSTSATG